jgi:hypothetical protein
MGKIYYITIVPSMEVGQARHWLIVGTNKEGNEKGGNDLITTLS